MPKNCRVCGKRIWFYQSQESRLVPGTGERLRFHSYCFHSSAWGRREREIRMEQIREFRRNREESGW